MDKLARARTALLLEKPYIGAMALRLTTSAVPWVESMAVDGKNLYYNPEYVESSGMDALKGMIAHEVFHCSAGHPWRRGEREPGRWNQACDYAINPMVRESGFPLFAGALDDRQFDGKSAEAIYNLLAANEQPERQESEPETEEGEGKEDGEGDEDSPGQDNDDDGGDGDGEDRDGDGQSGDDDQDGEGDGDGDGAEDGEASQPPGPPTTPDGRPMPAGQAPGMVLDAPPGEDGKAPTPDENRAAEEEWKLASAQAAQSAQARGMLPGWMKEMISEELAPRVPWQQLLREFMTAIARDDYSWARPNRRHVHNGLYLPSARSERLGTMVLFIDTSASMPSSLLGEFVSEVNAIIDELKPERLIAVQCDARVNETKEYGPEDYPIEIEWKGRGGTSFSPAFDWVEQNLDELPECAVYLTDMFGNFPDDPGYPVLWLDYGGGLGDDQSFGTRVLME